MNTETHSDAILVERCQRGELNAMDELFARYEHKAFLYSLRMTKHTDEASDVVAEGFIRIHRAICRFQSNATFSTWMFKILKNCFLDMKKKRRVNVVASLDESYESLNGLRTIQPIDDSESAHEMVTKQEFSAKVMTAVDRLPSNQRDLLLMYYSEQLTYEAMSKILATPAGTIKSRLHRAKRNLQQVIVGSSELSMLIA